LRTNSLRHRNRELISTYQGIKSGHQGKVATASGNPRDLDFFAAPSGETKQGWAEREPKTRTGAYCAVADSVRPRLRLRSADRQATGLTEHLRRMTKHGDELSSTGILISMKQNPLSLLSR
jgi:hypothetical protein